MENSTVQANENIKIFEVYYSFIELFGPNAKAEIFNRMDINNPIHIIGEHFLDTFKSRKLNENELHNITGVVQDISSLSPTLYMLDAYDLLKSLITCPDDTILSFNQILDEWRMINFKLNNISYSIIFKSPLLSFKENKSFLDSFWNKVKLYLLGKITNIRFECVKCHLPVFIQHRLEDILHIVRLISMQCVENKNINVGLLFVDDYTSFKNNFHPDLFQDTSTEINLFHIDSIKQPFFEIANGELGFLVIDCKMNIRGLFYPDNMPSGLDIINPSGKNLPDSLVVKVQGIKLSRFASGNNLIFEFNHGLIRMRNYSVFFSKLRNIFRQINIATGHEDQFIENIMEFSYKGKGTIAVIGPVLSNKYFPSAFNCKIPMIVDRSTQIYKESIFSQLASTDGAILMDSSLKIYAFAAILECSSNGTPTTSSGGSRTKTAYAIAKANPENCIIKISADGPISVYYNGKLELAI